MTKRERDVEKRREKSLYKKSRNEGGDPARERRNAQAAHSERRTRENQDLQPHAQGGRRGRRRGEDEKKEE